MTLAGLIDVFELPKGKALEIINLLAARFPDLVYPLTVLRNVVAEKAGDVITLPATVATELKELLDTGASEVHPEVID